MSASLAELALQREIERMTPEELAVMEQIMRGDDPLLDTLNVLEYDETPVDMETFLLDDHYLGSSGKDIYPQLIDDLVELFEGDCLQAVFTGGIGWGKSTIAEFGLARMIYEVSCLRNPQQTFGLMEGSTISFVNVSVTLSQAKNAIFKNLQTKLRMSPYFKTKFPYDTKVNTELRFPKHIWAAPGASNDNSVLGLNIFGGIIDEGNFMKVQEKKGLGGRKSKGVGNYDQAMSMYNQMLRRVESRFQKLGRAPGRLFIVSSAQYPDDFTSKMVKRAQDDDTIFVRDYPTWGPKPKSFYTGERFRVLVGGEASASKILAPHETVSEEMGQTISVPIEHKVAFQQDLDGAIRDIAGIPTITLSQYISNYEAVTNSVKRKAKMHPFTLETTTLHDGGEIALGRLFVPSEDGKGRVLRNNPDKPRVCHVDLALRHDCVGFAMGHISDHVKVLRQDAEGTETEEWAPVIFYDMFLQVRAPTGGEIIFSDIRHMIYKLKDMGVPIEIVTMDGWQSVDSIQKLRGHNIISDVVSVDRTTEAYDVLKAAFYDERVDMYDYPPVLKELRRLELDLARHKVDHPDGGGKDVSDAMAAVAYVLTKYQGRLNRKQMGAKFA